MIKFIYIINYIFRMSTKKVKALFVGSSFEGDSSLRALVDDPKFDVSAVITQPDRPVGRKQELTPTEIKIVAEKLCLKTYTPKSDESEYLEILENEQPEIIIVIAYGNILPKPFIEFPKFKCINVHYSLLPELRGAVPVQMAILQGLKKTGLTVQIMHYELDEGPILAQREIEIEERETTPSLKDKLIPLGRNLLMDTLHTWVDGKIEPKEQDHSKSTYCSQEDIAKENAQIDWEKMEPEHIDRLIRAMLPWPVAWTVLPDSKRMKIFEGELVKFEGEGNPGSLVKKGTDLLIPTRNNKAVKLKEVQLEGKNRMKAVELAHSIR